ncbi:MAG TPA: phage tail sheath family protein [Acidimicrobiales bacterium]|nr:phage tail sheath family protein [Acidimicrobiales bacterium]
MPTYLSPGVYVEELESGSRPIEGVGTAVAAFVGLAEKGPFNTPTLVTNWSQYVQNFGDMVEGTYLALSVFAYFQNGGGTAYVVRIGGGGAVQPAVAELTSGGESPLSAYKLTASEAGSVGNDITVTVADSEAAAGEEGAFKITVKQGDTVEHFDPVSTRRGRTNVVTVVNATSTLIRLEETSRTAVEAVARGEVTLAGGGESAPESMNAGDYVGDSAARSGVGGLEAIDEVTMLVVPDLMSAHEKGLIDLEGVKAVQLGMIAHCELMGDRLAIIDPPPGLNAQGIKDWRVDTAGYDSKYAALYWPWVKVFDPASGTNTFMPPSGHIAGIWSRNDDNRGVHKAPANEVIRGAIDIELNITKNEHDLLNPIGVNAIRAFPGRGIRVWGARTLSSDAAWRYINVRRLFNYLEESILSGTDWVVFEPNDRALWAKIRRTIASFLVNEWRKGALFGASPAEAFYVKCDDETNPAEGIDAGQVVCEIGLAPVKPAEFVIFRLSQFSGGSSLVAE